MVADVALRRTGDPGVYARRRASGVCKDCSVRIARATPPFTNRTFPRLALLVRLAAADGDEDPVAGGRVGDVGPAHGLFAGGGEILRLARPASRSSRVPTRSVRKYTARAQLKPSGAPEPASGRGETGGGGRPARFCQEQTLVLAEQFGSTEHDGFRVPYLSENNP